MTTQKKTITNENKFPIRIVSGSIQASISGYIDSSNSRISMDTSSSGEELSDKEREYFDEANRTSVTFIESSLADYGAGEYIFHRMRKNEVVTVLITLKSNDAIIESGKKLYYLTKEKPVLKLIIQTYE